MAIKKEKGFVPRRNGRLGFSSGQGQISDTATWYEAAYEPSQKSVQRFGMAQKETVAVW